MKKLFLIINFLSLLVLFTSCSEEILPSTDGKQTAVVYATLNQKDSVHFVKITKAFYGGGNSLEIAQIPDSSYFNKVEATVKEYVSGNLTRTFVLKDTIVTNKDQNGAFYAPEQKLYYFKTSSSEPLLSDAKYDLKVIINDGEFEVTSSKIELVSNINISIPLVNSSFSFEKNQLQGTYASSNIMFSRGNSKKIEAKLIIEFDEYIGSNIAYNKTFSWDLANIDADELGNNANVTVEARGQLFYELVKLNVTNDNLISKRKLKGITIRIDGASNDLQKYMIVNQPSSSLAQNKPTYTNLTATNGHRVRGIFASRGYVERYKADWVFAGGSAYYTAINKNSMNELAKGTITGNLLFCTDNPVYNGANPESYYCP